MQHLLTSGVRPGPLGVVGNISRDLVAYSDGRARQLLGGAALYVALAATRAGMPAAPAAVIGADLNWIRADPHLAGMDLSRVKATQGKSCTFSFAYDEAGAVTSTTASFGVSEGLTSHALDVLDSCPAWHVCCRRPLNGRSILDRLAKVGLPFSVDFHLASVAQVMGAVQETLPLAAAIFVNATEFAILARATDLSALRLVVVSDGPRPAVVLRRGEVTASDTPADVPIVEVTGAGDTLTGTFLAAMARGLNDDGALRAAVRAATGAVAGSRLVVPSDGG